MPLNLTTRTLDRVPPHQPLRDQLANHIRHAVASGQLQPGEPLPGEFEIARAVGIDRTTVRFAVNILVAEGVLTKANGRRTIVAPPAPVRRMDTMRYRDELSRLRAGIKPDTAAFVTDHDATWEQYTMDPLVYSEVLATEYHARHLEVPVGELLIERFAVKNLDDVPMQIQRSFIPYEHAFGTILADPSVQPYPGGTLAELYDVGLLDGNATPSVREEAGGHPASPEERKLLGMEIPGQVWRIVRVISVNGKPIEMSEVIAPMARNVLRYETDLS